MGKHLAQIAEIKGQKFDFVILDSGHMHPIESLNFLTILPFLTDDAVVVLHDINLHLADKSWKFPAMPLAGKILFDTVTADKITCQKSFNLPANIGAFQLTEDTRTNIDDVFSSLFFPWGLIPKHMKDIGNIISGYYSEKQCRAFESARMVSSDFIWENIGKTVCDVGIDTDVLKKRFDAVVDAERFILYGGGKNAPWIINAFKLAQMRLPDVVWDVRAQAAQTIEGIPVVKPDFMGLSNKKDSLVCSISNVDVLAQIFDQCEENDFYNHAGLEVLLMLIGSDATKESFREAPMSPKSVVEQVREYLRRKLVDA